MIEAGRRDCGEPTATGTLTDTDVDNPHNTFTPVCAPETSAADFGSFTMTADGVWTYTLDNDNCEVQALDSCDTLTDCFKVTTIDGTAQMVTITIQGTNDGHHFNWFGAADLFQFKDEISGLDGSNFIDLRRSGFCPSGNTNACRTTRGRQSQLCSGAVREPRRFSCAARPDGVTASETVACRATCSANATRS